MTLQVLRHRAIGRDELIGHVICIDGGWTASGNHADVAGRTYPTADAAEAALRHEDDQARGRRIIAGSFIGFLAAHPVLFVLSGLI